MRKLFITGVLLLLVGAGCPQTEPAGAPTPQTPAEPAPVSTEAELPLVNPDAVEPSVLPTQGPYLHTVRSASSVDGLTFTDDREEDLVDHASVPTAMAFPDGTIRSYFVDFGTGTESFECVESTDDGQTWSWGDCELLGMASPKAVDISVVALRDGRYRLYYYASAENVGSSGAHNIDSAISKDGVTFTREGTVFTYDGLVDPDVFWNGKEWIIHVFSLKALGTVVATSADGLSFVYVGMLSPSGYGVTEPVALPDGTFRMYAFKQPDATTFVSLTSNDGYAWTLEDGVRFETEEGYQITDPFVIPLTDGTYKMFYKREKTLSQK
jgi:hypothetical protein